MRRIISIVLALSLAMGLCACGQNVEEHWQEQYDLGVRYLSEGNYEEAILAFEEAIAIDPKRPEAYLAMSDLYLSQGEKEKAIAVLEKAKQYSEDTTLIQSKLDELAPSCEPLTIKIASVEYEEDLLGDIEGTPTTITILYNCPEEGDYQVSLNLMLGEEWITKLGTELSFADHNRHTPAVSGMGEITIQTRLLLFDTGRVEERFQLRGELLTRDDTGFYTCIYEDIYTFPDSFGGISLPVLPEYDGIYSSTIHTGVEDVVLTGTPVRFDDEFKGYGECVLQYAYHLDTETSGIVEVIRLDKPMEFPDGTVGQYMSLSYDMMFNQNNPDFFENYYQTPVTLRGRIAVRDGGIRGMSLLKNEGREEVLFALPYDFIIEGME